MPTRRSAVVPSNAPRDDVYFSLSSLASYADLSVRTLRTYLTDATNPLPHYKMRGKILVKRSDFDAWMRHFRVDGEDTITPAVDAVMEALR